VPCLHIKVAEEPPLAHILLFLKSILLAPEFIKCGSRVVHQLSNKAMQKHWANNETAAIGIIPNARQKKSRYMVYRLKQTSLVK